MCHFWGDSVSDISWHPNLQWDKWTPRMDGCSSCQVPKAPPKLPRAPKAPKRLHWAPLPSPEQVGSESKGDTFRKVHHVESCWIMFIILDLVFAMFPSAIVKSRWFFSKSQIGRVSVMVVISPRMEPRVMGASTMFKKSTPQKNVFHWGT